MHRCYPSRGRLKEGADSRANLGQAYLQSFKGGTHTVIKKIEEEGFHYKVSDGSETADVKIVKGKDGKYLRTERDGTHGTTF